MDYNIGRIIKKKGEFKMDNNNFYKRTNKYNLEQILKHKDTIYIFDIDGTLTDFNYDIRDFAEQIERPNDYKQIRPLKTLQKFISKLNMNNVYSCSRSIFPEEHQSKTEFLIENYHMKPENIFFVYHNKDKIDVVKKIWEKTGVDSELILVVEDNPVILDDITLETNFSNMHISYFIE